MFGIKDDDLHKIRQTFAMFDEDDSSTITINEIGNIYKALGHNLSKKQLSEMIERNDLNKDGHITFHEFLSMYKRDIHFKTQEEKLMEAFKMCDCDGNKYITLNELKRIMKEVGENLNDRELILMVKEVDKDGDDRINFEEFIELMKKPHI